MSIGRSVTPADSNATIASAGFSELAKHFFLNLSASGWGLLLALITTPIVVHRLGPSRYGVYALLGVLLSHLQFAQLGLARAVERESAVALGAKRQQQARRYFETALTIQCGIALLVTVILSTIGPLGLTLFRIDPELETTAAVALRLFSLNVGVGLVTGIGQAFLRAHRDFLSLNRISVITQTALSGMVLSVALVRPSLTGVVAAVVVASTLRLLLVFFVILRLLEWRLTLAGDRSCLRRLLRLGLPLTFNSILGPVLANLEKVLSAALIGAEALTYYIVPFRVLSRFSVVAGALNRALFPLFSRQEGEADYAAMRRANVRATVALAWLLLPPLAALRIAGTPLLALWMGEDFATLAAPLLPLLLLGTWLNLLAWNTVAVIQARGRPLLLTWLYVGELALYIPVATYSMRALGLLGAAVAWFARVAFDAGMLWALSRWLFRGQPRAAAPRLLHVLSGIVLLALGEAAHALLRSPLPLVGVALFAAAAWMLLAWQAALSRAQRVSILDLLSRLISARDSALRP